MGALEGAAGAAQEVQLVSRCSSSMKVQVEEFRKGSNQRAAERRAERQLELRLTSKR